jgi:hypothetical protein
MIPNGRVLRVPAKPISYRRVDYYNERAAQTTAGPDDAITGFPGAAGVVEGTARVLCTPEDGAPHGRRLVRSLAESRGRFRTDPLPLA